MVEMCVKLVRKKESISRTLRGMSSNSMHDRPRKDMFVSHENKDSNIIVFLL